MLENMLAVANASRWLFDVAVAIWAVRQAARWLVGKDPGRAVFAWISRSEALKAIGSAAFVASMTIVIVLLALKGKLGTVLPELGVYGFIMVVTWLVSLWLDRAHEPK